MSLNIPWEDARDFAEQHCCDQIIIHGYKHGEGQCIATWGKTIQDSDNAATGGNFIKRELLGWPQEASNAVPDRVRILRSRTTELIEKARAASCCCACSPKRRLSGHSNDCFAPGLIEATEQAAEYLKALFPEPLTEKEVRS